MDEFKIISTIDPESFNTRLQAHIKDNWLPYGNLCANVSIGKGQYGSSVEYLYSIMLIRKFNKKET